MTASLGQFLFFLGVCSSAAGAEDCASESDAEEATLLQFKQGEQTETEGASDLSPWCFAISCREAKVRCAAESQCCDIAKRCIPTAATPAATTTTTTNPLLGSDYEDLCDTHEFTYTSMGVSWTGLGCTFEAIAKSWVAVGGSQSDCAYTMAIALGEGANPDCKTGSYSYNTTCLQTTYGFPLDQPAYDYQCTLGPWQVLTNSSTATNPEDRAQEAMDYVMYNCGTNSGSPSGCSSEICLSNDKTYPDCTNPSTGSCLCATCNTTTDGVCDKSWDTSSYPTTIFDTSIGPFCGCAVGNAATTGWSGRCNDGDTDYYQEFMTDAQTLCDAITW
mmetsp:Transcript_77913/g.137362  ORF Transcript_77913/g.137362 Transcript_77913/m.137362 type:complete len:332 (+) Transcript_77913:71-1066(+)